MPDTFGISVLSSGSQGNALYIESNKERLLVDAGLSGKKIEQLLASIGRSAKDLTGILVTHEHRDHVAGVGVLARRYHLNVYANMPTWNEMDHIIGNIPNEQRFDFPLGSVQTIGDLDVESYGVSHDATAPQFYRLHQNGRSFAILTDTGYCSERLKDQLKDSDAYLIETNHDIHMLRASRYPWQLQQRILGDQGHLSNEDSADTMVSLVGNHTRKFYLGHRSQEANHKQLAHKVVEQTLNMNDIDTVNTVICEDVDPEAPTELYYL